MENKENGGEGVCLSKIQFIDFYRFFLQCKNLPQILPHIKIRVTVAVSLSALDFVEGGGAAGRRGLRLKGPVYLIGWRRRLHVF
jgi:hypothetical protein